MKTAKKYRIEILTLAGPIIIFYDSSKMTLEQFEKDTLEKYGTFTTIQSKEMNVKMSPKEKQELLTLAHNTLSFVVPNYKSYTFKEWAEFIKKSYSMENPKIEAIVNLLESDEGKIWNQHTLSKIEHVNIHHTLRH
tara:strand:- start:287 stop:694 length:408 start_codon:yes stop_codon:yes gene_type:complete